MSVAQELRKPASERHYQAEAIRYVRYEEPNPGARYRNPHVTPADLVKANG